ncbi:hypothetical protein M9Y10_043246 [Tritrichomonas musculus]|uniref:Myb-like DNA-binding domain containing protein n=1 Tax=Tritrichomonas musculus TaxID=1915356 RepID=A0ABR2JZ51_9EUKA
MICSIIVEKKNNIPQEKISDRCSDVFNSNPISPNDLYQYVQSVTAKWAKAKPKNQCLKSVSGAKKHKWSSEEDQMLRQAINRFGVDNWKSVALIVPGRTGKQCRERWLSHMCPTLVHAEWSLQEDIILIQKQKDIGNKWSVIANFLPGRSTTSVKNRWNYLCRRDIPAHSEEYEKIVNTLSYVQHVNFQKDKNVDNISPSFIEEIANPSPTELMEQELESDIFFF